MKLLPFNHSGEKFQLYICLFKCAGRDYKFMINQDTNNQTESILGGGRIYLALYWINHQDNEANLNSAPNPSFYLVLYEETTLLKLKYSICFDYCFILLFRWQWLLWNYFLEEGKEGVVSNVWIKILPDYFKLHKSSIHETIPGMYHLN